MVCLLWSFICLFGWVFFFFFFFFFFFWGGGSDVNGRKEMFYLTTHSTHFIYGYMALDIW